VQKRGKGDTALLEPFSKRRKRRSVDKEKQKKRAERGGFPKRHVSGGRIPKMSGTGAGGKKNHLRLIQSWSSPDMGVARSVERGVNKKPPPGLEEGERGMDHQK